MLNANSTPKHLWAEAINTTCYLQNRIYIRPLIKKTPYELWKNKKPNISYFHPFGVQCFILNNKDSLGKFDSKSDEEILLGYSESYKAYRVYNSRTSSLIKVYQRRTIFLILIYRNYRKIFQHQLVKH